MRDGAPGLSRTVFHLGRQTASAPLKYACNMLFFKKITMRNSRWAQTEPRQIVPTGNTGAQNCCKKHAGIDILQLHSTMSARTSAQRKHHPGTDIGAAHTGMHAPKKKPPENRRHSAGCPATGLQRQTWTPGLRGEANGRSTSDNVTGGSVRGGNVTAPRSQQQSRQTPGTPQPDRAGTAPAPKKGGAGGRNQYSSAGLTGRAARFGRVGRRAAERLSVEVSSSAARQAASSWGESG